MSLHIDKAERTLLLDALDALVKKGYAEADHLIREIDTFASFPVPVVGGPEPTETYIQDLREQLEALQLRNQKTEILIHRVRDTPTTENSLLF